MQTILRGLADEAVIGPDLATVIIGERINPTGRKAFSAELQSGNLSRIVSDALAQVNAGANVLDVNVGAVGVDEVKLLPQAVQLAQDTVSVPLSIDSANPEALAAALKVYKGRALVNSVNGEPEKLDRILPIVAESGAAVIALCMDNQGIQATPELRLEVAEKILERGQAAGLQPEDIVFDPLVLTLGADHRAGLVTIETARLLRQQLGCNLTAGASNASHGMPERELLNIVLLTLLIEAGINAPICNPEKAALAVRAADLALGRDEWGMAYIQRYRQTTTTMA
jgi:5-methyltetrahydrofolate--homocysteine methyltransferase